jgi:hypothetical protein
MWKNPSRGEAVMSDAALLGEATGWAKRLTRAEARGPGDIENAWRRLEARYGIPWRSFWALRYRPPRNLAASTYLRLQAAYRAECERQIKRLEHEVAITKAKTGPDHAAVVKAEAVLRATKRGRS